MLLSYFQLLPLYTEHINRFRAAWAEAWRSVVCVDEWAYLEEGNESSRYPMHFSIRWGCVFGPLTALIATLAQYRWFGRYMDRWYGPDGF